ncbi:hypothetical protein ATANTOWER_022760, partial [Ataeniobius toweri]|nr:hypothetical protein [Ataeniobius toweri]
ATYISGARGVTSVANGFSDGSCQQGPERSAGGFQSDKQGGKRDSEALTFKILYCSSTKLCPHLKKVMSASQGNRKS